MSEVPRNAKSNIVHSTFKAHKRDECHVYAKPISLAHIMSITLTIDEGTTSTRALLIADDGSICGIAQQEFTQIFPQAGWVEHDAEEIWVKTLEVARAVISACTGASSNSQTIKITVNQKIKASDITNIAITNQRETTVVWDRSTAKPVHNAIVWQCRRTSDYCAELRTNTKFADLVRKRTGLYIDSYFSGPKLRWILDHFAKRHPERSEGSLQQNLAFGTIDSWLIYKLTGEHLTEPSNASRTMLYDIVDGKWSEEILSELKIPASVLPKVVPSNSNFGNCDLFTDLVGHSLAITGVLGDQQAALYAYHATQEGLSKNVTDVTFLRSQPQVHNPQARENKALSSKVTYGTGTFVLVEAPEFTLRDGLITTVFYDDGGKHHYAIEGSVFVGGALIQWLRDGLKIIESSSEIEALAKSVPDHGGIYFVPALAGLGAPYWREDVRGTILGITRGTQRGHIARAALEAMAFRVRDIFEALGGAKLTQVNVDGGATANNLLMQFQADLLQIPVQRYSEKEMTALGAAIMAKAGKGEKIKMRNETCFKPELKLETRYAEWKSYVGKLIN